MSHTVAGSIPNYDVADVLRGWRSRAVTMVLYAAAISALPTVVSAIVLGDRFSAVTAVMFVIYLSVVVNALWRKLDYRIRGSAIIVAGYAMSVNSFMPFGLEGSGRSYLIVMPMMAFILIGIRAGWITTLVSVAIYGVFMQLAASGTLAQWLVPAYDRLDFVMWSTTGLTMLMLLVVVVALFISMYRFLLKALVAERVASNELLQTYDATLEGWAHALELRDLETAGHCQRVSDVAGRLATRTGMAEDGLKDLYRGSLLHDVGKIGVPDRILLKPGKLTAEEFTHMQRHTTYAHDLLLHIPFLRKALDIPYCHHEKWDGSGYPRGLKGKEIPLSARVFSVVDVFDALTSDRCYRPGWPRESALEYIRRKAGVEFDPAVVEAFLCLESEGAGNSGDTTLDSVSRSESGPTTLLTAPQDRR